MRSQSHVSCIVAVTLALPVCPALGQSTAFTYQGRLTDAGAPADGRHDFRFRLFDAAQGGSQVGETLCADDVDVVDGLITITLDFDQQFATPDERHLEIDVRRDTGLNCSNGAGFVLLAPRQELTAAPRASHANPAFSLAAADGSPADAVFVDDAGNVGVGTATPLAKLHVDSGDLHMGLPTNGWFLHTRVPFNGDFLHLTDTVGGVPQFQRGLALTKIGNLGVGTSAPAAKLEVRGDIRLGPAGQLRAAGGEVNLRIICGSVAADGEILVGSGFTVRHNSVGNYVITFNTPFPDPPSVTGTADSLGFETDWTVMTRGVTGANATLVIIRGEHGFWDDAPFHFIAIGPR